VEDADESVGELAQGGVVAGSAGRSRQVLAGFGNDVGIVAELSDHLGTEDQSQTGLVA
jgi:hypothetical protein